jgi:crotonobetainyl-CoA:carnitine CoA-transferase CaiB-like acyl-CoA transferase
MSERTAETRLRERMAEALRLDGGRSLPVTGSGTLESDYPVSELASASVASVALAAGELALALGHPWPEPSVDRELADAWFGLAVRPVGWELPSPWDAIAGDYPTSDGWIRLHTNAPHHRAAALRVLGIPGERTAVENAVSHWSGESLEGAVVAEGGCAAVLRTPTEWAAHPQGAAVAREPLVAFEKTDADDSDSAWRPDPERPLAGLRVLDLTRVLAGPVATRALAALGADVLRVDPPSWDEPALVADMTLGKRTTRIDAHEPAGHERLLTLVSEADVLVHGYRADALERLGLGDVVRRATRPGLVDVSLDAYGHTGPWSTRRGFDSLVQMSSGIAYRPGSRPVPLPVQGLDQATGYLAAAAALVGLATRLTTGRGTRARLSLARTGVELEAARPHPREPVGPATATAGTPLDTPWGPATVLSPPFQLAGVRIGWDRPPRDLGSDPAAWGSGG